MEALGLYMMLMMGTFGMAMLLYGKNTHRVPHIVAGLALLVFPHFTASVPVVLIVGGVLIVAPFLFS